MGHIVQDVDDAVHHLASPQQLHQLTGPVDGGQRVHGVQALLELGGRLGAHTQGQRAPADAGAVEAGGLEHHVVGVVHDLGVQPAHDARQTYRPALVGNDQMVGVQRVLPAVQGGELFALSGTADDDLPAVDIAVVEGVHGLAVLQHDVVGDVHDVVDGPHSHGAKPLPHPLGGGGDLHVAHHPGGVPGHQIGGGGLHVQQLGEHAVRPALHLRGVEGEGLVKGSRRLPGQADDGQAVRAVGGDLELHHMVVQADDGLDVVSGPAVLLEDEDAVGDAVGELLLLGVEVGQGADGPALGVEGHQIHGVEVLTARLHRGAHGLAVLRPQQAAGPAAVPQGLDLPHPGAHHRAVDLGPRLDIRRNGGLGRVDGVVVA